MNISVKLFYLGLILMVAIRSLMVKYMCSFAGLMAINMIIIPPSLQSVTWRYFVIFIYKNEVYNSISLKAERYLSVLIAFFIAL